VKHFSYVYFFIFFCMATSSISPNVSASSFVFKRHAISMPVSLDPQKIVNIRDMSIIIEMYEPLVHVTYTGWTPGAATGYTVSPDGLTYTFTLRPDGRWSNGESVVAEDYVYAWRRAMDPISKSKAIQNLSLLKNARAILAGTQKPEKLGVVAKDQHTLVVTLEKPVSFFASVLDANDFFPLHRKSIEKGAKFINRDMPTNGAYYVDHVSLNERLVLKKNPHFFEAKDVSINQVNYVLVKNDNLALQSYKKDEIQLIERLPDTVLPKLSVNLKAELNRQKVNRTFSLALNMQKAPLTDLRVRKALGLSVNRTELVKLLGTSDKPTKRWLMGQGSAYPEFPYTETYDKDITKAKQLFNELGYTKDKPLVLDFIMNNHSLYIQIVNFVQGMWRQVFGDRIKFNNQTSEWQTFMATIKNDQKWHGIPHNFLNPIAHPYGMLQYMQGDSLVNQTHFKNKAFDDLIKKGLHTLDNKAAIQFFVKGENVLLNSFAHIPLVYMDLKHLQKPVVKGGIGNSIGILPSRTFHF
jgi:oligopeptide transport system substrate-binding protein